MGDPLDPAKNTRNIAERGLSFELVWEFDWETAIAEEDARRDYRERRMRVLAFLGTRRHAAVVTYRDGAMRVIGFRKANRREVRRYGRERGRIGIAS